MGTACVTETMKVVNQSIVCASNFLPDYENRHTLPITTHQKLILKLFIVIH